MTIKSLLPWIKCDGPGKYRVGACSGDYSGPVAEVYAANDWLVVSTDNYEGHAMINIETLPMLIDALTRLQSDIAQKNND